MDAIRDFLAIGLMAGALVYIVYGIVKGRGARSQLTQVGNENTAAIRENTAAVREHTEFLRQYLVAKASETA